MWLLVTFAALDVLALSIPAALDDLRAAPAAMLFALAAAICELFSVLLVSRPGAQVHYSVSAAVLAAAILLFPPYWAVLAAAAAMAAAEVVERRRTWFKIVYNVANVTLSAALAMFVWQLGGAANGIGALTSLPWAVAAVLTFFAANTLLTAAIVALVLHLPIGVVWWRSHRRILTSNLGVLFVGVPIAGVWLTFPWMLVFVAVALVALHHALHDRVRLETQTLESLFDLADILDARDKYTHGHSERVGAYAEQLAVQLGLSSERTHLVFLAGRLHDIGKCAITNEVLLKPAALDEEERDHMRQHPEVGSAMLAHFSLFREVARFVRGHHERWDGTGYPDGLKGEEIPLEARIIAVVDSYDAMTTTRPYRAALPVGEAIQRLRRGAHRQWDPRVVEAFVTWLAGQPAYRESVAAQPSPQPSAVSTPS